MKVKIYQIDMFHALDAFSNVHFEVNIIGHITNIMSTR